MINMMMMMMPMMLMRAMIMMVDGSGHVTYHLSYVCCDDDDGGGRNDSFPVAAYGKSLSADGVTWFVQHCCRRVCSEIYHVCKGLGLAGQTM